jgi:hypothetical protein
MRLRDRPRDELADERPSSLPVFEWLGIGPTIAAAADRPPPAPPQPSPGSDAVAAVAAPSAASRGPRLACRVLGHRIEDHVVDGFRLRNYAPGGILRCARCGQVNRRWQGWR